MANGLLDNAGFIDFLSVQESSGFVAPGLVIRSEPPAGQLAATNEMITVFVSSGPAQVQVPNVLGNAEDAATTALEDQQLVVVVGEGIDLAPGDPNIGTVVDVQPQPGSQVLQGTPVTIRIGREGQNTTTIDPNNPDNTTDPNNPTNPTDPNATTVTTVQDPTTTATTAPGNNGNNGNGNDRNGDDG